MQRIRGLPQEDLAEVNVFCIISFLRKVNLLQGKK
jgi:hypothetical protein